MVATSYILSLNSEKPCEPRTLGFPALLYNLVVGRFSLIPIDATFFKPHVAGAIVAYRNLVELVALFALTSWSLDRDVRQLLAHYMLSC